MKGHHILHYWLSEFIQESVSHLHPRNGPELSGASQLYLVLNVTCQESRKEKRKETVTLSIISFVPIQSKLSHLLPVNYPISISGTLSTTIFCHRGHYFFSLSPSTESCFPLTFTRAPRACWWGTRRMPIVMFLCDKGVSAATTFVAKKHPQ